MKHAKKISIFVLSLLILFGVSVSFFSGTHTAYACYCYPNLAVYPDGNDPNCVNHVGNAVYCGQSSVSGTTNVPGVSGSASSFACTPSAVKDFKSLIENLIIGCFYTLAVRIIIGLGIVIFFYGVFKFVRTDSETEKEAGKQFMLWGIVGIFVMVSIMGLVAILQNTLALSNTSFTIPH